MILYRCDACGKECATNQMIQIEFKYYASCTDFVYNEGDVCIECATDLNNKAYEFKRNFFRKKED